MISLSIGRDVNGNKVLKATRSGWRGFSVQTLGNLEYTHSVRSDEDLDYGRALAELKEYVIYFGTPYQLGVLGIETGENVRKQQSNRYKLG